MFFVMANIGNGCAIIWISPTNSGMDTLPNGALACLFGELKNKGQRLSWIDGASCAVRLY